MRHLRPEVLVFDALDEIPWDRAAGEQPMSLLQWGDSTAAFPLLTVGDQPRPLAARPHGPHDGRQFQRLREQNTIALAVPRALDERRLELKLWAFHSRTWDVPIDVAVDDRAAQDLRRFDSAVTTVAEAVDWLTEETIVRVGDAAFVLVSGIPLDAQLAESFSVHGAARTVQLDASGEGCSIARIVPRARPSPRHTGTMALAEGEFRYVERGEARALADEYRRLRHATNETPYLRAWARYEELSMAREIGDARRVGAIPFADATQESDQRWRARLVRAEDVIRLDPRERYHAVASVPRALLSSGHDAEALRTLADEVGRSGTSALKLLELTAPYVDFGPASTAKLMDPPPRDGYLILSLAGALAQDDRRRKARERLSQHHGLSLALAGRRPPPPPRAARKLPFPLPPEVESVFGHGITDGQRRALAAVYENRGITIIQGPPGTGKSTVIAALHKLLVHLHGDEVRRSIVVSAPQHEAVATVASKIDVFGLPAIRLGREADGRREVERWAAAQAVRIGQQIEHRGISSLEVPERVAALRQLAVRYQATPMPLRETVRLLNALAREGAERMDDGETILSFDLRHRLQAHADVLAARTTSDDDALRRRRNTIRRSAALLRLNPVTFLDDGPQAAARARAALAGIGHLDLDVAEVLDRAIAAPEPSRECLAELAQVRAQLLDALGAASDLDRRSVRDTAATQLTGRVVQEIGAWLERHTDPVERVLRRLRERTLHDPDGLAHAVETYSVALAATAQGVGGRAFADLTGEQTIRTAIVDEAARGHPLDVLIPLVRASERQVLVGDHRQLPQLLEPEIAKDVEGQLGPELGAALEQSLFESLFETLSGSPRCVTLDTQFRMHPDLGEFVSTAFYPPAEQFSSGRRAEDFEHGLAGRYAGRVAVWLDGGGDDERRVPGGSFTRRAEARQIAAAVREILDDRPDLSVGIVSMYAAQVGEVQRALAELDVLRAGDDGYDLTDDRRWVLGADGRPVEEDGHHVERLAIGTVDSFQGREFDVVFVSLVRCNEAPTPRTRLGFTALRNRLNVAMSRQRRLLVVCGSQRTFLGGVAAGWDDTAPFRAFDALTQRTAAAVAREPS